MGNQINLIHVGDKPWVVIEGDSNLTPKAIESGDIFIEKQIMSLDVIKDLSVTDVVVDAGAFIGETAIPMARNGAMVFAFEAQFDAYCACVINCAGTGLRIEVNNMALGNGEAVDLGSGTMNDSGNLGTRTVSMGGSLVAHRIDSCGIGRVTLIKLDVEGFELNVLKGAERTIDSWKPKLLIEVYPEMMAKHGNTTDALYEWLSSHGYEWSEVVGNSTEPRWDILATRRKS